MRDIIQQQHPILFAYLAKSLTLYSVFIHAMMYTLIYYPLLSRMVGVYVEVGFKVNS